MTDKTISIYWFFILFIIASAIAFIVYSLYGKPLDIRSVEGVFLAEKVADCVSRGGKISPEGEILIKGGKISEICHLNFKVEQFKDSWNNDQFYVSLDFFTVEGNSLTHVRFVPDGNENLKINSNVNFIDSNKKNLPFCAERTIYSNGQTDNKYYSIKIFACVNKEEKNV